MLAQDGISDPNASYMTLSYRWGQNPTLLLLGSNIDSFRAGRSIRDLPLTFREFFTVARRFSINYVWIDALCIIQDSEKDWEAEAPAMRDVYANSACNVAASASCNPEGGLFRTREPDSKNPPISLLAYFLITLIHLVTITCMTSTTGITKSSTGHFTKRVGVSRSTASTTGLIFRGKSSALGVFDNAEVRISPSNRSLS